MLHGTEKYNTTLGRKILQTIICSKVAKIMLQKKNAAKKYVCRGHQSNDLSANYVDSKYNQLTIHRQLDLALSPLFY